MKWGFDSFLDFLVDMFNRSVSARFIDCKTINVRIEMRSQNSFTPKASKELSKLLDDLIANNQSKAVIDLSEIIYVHKHYFDNAVFFLCPPDKISQQANEIISVIESRKYIKVGHIGELFVLVFKLGDILKTDYLIRCLSLLVIHDSSFAFHPGFSILQPDNTAVRIQTSLFKEQKLFYGKNIFFFYLRI